MAHHQGAGPAPVSPEIGLEGLLPYEQAVALVLQQAAHLSPLGDEEVPLEAAVGRVLAEEVVAEEPFPPLVRSAMDGFAVRSDDVASASQERPVELELVGTATAGAPVQVELVSGRCLRIMTGVPLPRGADAVVPQEQAALLDGQRVQVQVSVRPGAYTFPAGEDAAAGEVVVARGSVLSPGQVAMLAALGRARVRVRRRPLVAVAATGDEVVGVEARALQPGQVRNSNGYGVVAQMATWGAEPRLFGIVPDDEAALERMALEMARVADALVLTGGMSVGLKDLVRPVLERLGVRWLMHRVAIRPGRPVAFGLWEGRPVFGLPGTPAGCMVAAELFVRPLVSVWLQGRWQAPEWEAVLERPLKSTPGRMRFLRGRAYPGPDGRYRAEVLPIQSSASVRSMADARALIVVPPEVGEVAAGGTVRVRLL